MNLDNLSIDELKSRVLIKTESQSCAIENAFETRSLIDVCSIFVLYLLVINFYFFHVLWFLFGTRYRKKNLQLIHSDI